MTKLWLQIMVYTWCAYNDEHIIQLRKLVQFIYMTDRWMRGLGKMITPQKYVSSVLLAGVDKLTHRWYCYSFLSHMVHRLVPSWRDKESHEAGREREREKERMGMQRLQHHCFWLKNCTLHRTNPETELFLHLQIDSKTINKTLNLVFSSLMTTGVRSETLSSTD